MNQSNKDFIHIKAPKNWINDPNGFIYYKGKYHMFYQHFPYEPSWGTMHWGHATSTDLVTWQHEGIALYPSKSYDANGVFSGNAIIIEDKLYLYYTGIKYIEAEPSNIHLPLNYNFEACQALLISEDGEHFDNINGKTCVIPVSDDDKRMSIADTRDPKVWEKGGRYYMALGSTEKTDTGRRVGKIIFLQSKDGFSWSYLSDAKSSEFGEIFECPDLFDIDGQTIMFCAAVGYLKDGFPDSNQEIYKFVSFDEETGRLTYDKESFYIDYGFDLYATQTTLDEDNNRVMYAWMRMPVPVACEDSSSMWSGIMTMPRVIKLKKDESGAKLVFAPHKKVDNLFHTRITSHELPFNLCINGTSDSHYIDITMADSKNDFKLSLDVEDGCVIDIGGYIIKIHDGFVMADRSALYPKGNYRMEFSTPKIEGDIHLDIYLSRYMIETFVNSGEYVLSHVVYDFFRDR